MVQTIQINTVLFFKSDFQGDFENISLKIKALLGESKFTQIVPLPKDFPSNIPRLILRYDNFNINVSKNSLEFSSKEFLKEKIGSIVKLLIDSLELQIGRIGFVKKLFSEKGINELKNLIQMDKVKALEPVEDNLKEINMRINFKKTFGQYDCNNVQALEMATSEAAGVKKDGVIITRDINTLAEKIVQYVFSPVELLNLIEGFNMESEKFF